MVQMPAAPSTPLQKKNRHTAALIIGILVALGVLGKVGLGNGGSSSDLPATYCDGIGRAGQTFQDATNGTLTGSEFVAQVDAEENEISGSALLVSDPAKAAAIRQLADSLGRFKVAIDNGANIDPATQGLTDALAAAPQC